MTRLTVIAMALSLILGLKPAFSSEDDSAEAVLSRYFQIAVPDSGLMGPTRGDRISCLWHLHDVPEDAVPALSASLSSATHVVHRVELLEALGKVRSRSSADAILEYLDDPDARVRLQAIRSLRAHASRIHRRGIDAPREPQFPPPVDGLVPHLISAARSEVGRNRSSALYALANTRDSLAQAELHRALRDTAETIRFTAAYLLSEFHDDAGLPELRSMLSRLVADKQSDSFKRYMWSQQLLAAFERLTGESLGLLPILPGFSSSLSGQAEAKRDYEVLLVKWSDWWAQNDERDR